MPINGQPYRPPGKGGGVAYQLADASGNVGPVVSLPLATLRMNRDARLGEDTESDDLGAHFSASGAHLFRGTIMLHRRDSNNIEALGLVPGIEILRLWFKWGSMSKGVMVWRCTVSTQDDDIQEIAPNMPIQIEVQGGAIYTNVNLPTVGATPPLAPVLPAGS